MKVQSAQGTQVCNTSKYVQIRLFICPTKNNFAQTATWETVSAVCLTFMLWVSFSKSVCFLFFLFQKSFRLGVTFIIFILSVICLHYQHPLMDWHAKNNLDQIENLSEFWLIFIMLVLVRFPQTSFYSLAN